MYIRIRAFIAPFKGFLGGESPLNIFGKSILLPMIIPLCFTWGLLDVLFTKQTELERQAEIGLI